MLKKLSEAQLERLLEAGVEAFSLHGPAGASMRSIADRAGVSVGVLYKYYGDKEGFLRACLDRSLAALDEVLTSVTAEEAGFRAYARRLIRALLQFSRERGGYVRLYCALAASGGAAAQGLAEEIEGAAARLYRRAVAAGQAAGDLRRDVDPGLLAFFFDSLLMMVQFSGCCGYYRERFRLYCGAAPEDQEDRLEEELLRFLESAFTFDASEIVHKTQGREPSAPQHV
ncbi:MAG: TetR/AcrR family transcriptional regulator [Oscillospiraceae bacterium]|jgi:TetR/AcrR family transcriptional regulator|nr:TetR/AcrR family transcriptional regulator [Oscillospiraceae bacterium]